MKKLFFIATLLVIALVSCTKSQIVEVVSQEPLSFTAFANKVVKAPITNLNTAQQTIYVWGYKTSGTTTNPVFNAQGNTAFAQTDVPETVTFNGSNWTYSPLRYWDKSQDRYDFFAIAPEKGSAYKSALAKINYPDFEVASTIENQIDLLVASPVTINLTSQASTGSINFNFRHALSKVGIKVKSHSAQVIEIQNITVKNVPCKGSVEFTWSTDKWESNWTMDNTINKDFQVQRIVSFNAITTPTNDPSTITYTTYLENLLFIPQTFSNLIVEVAYKCGEKSYTKNAEFNNITLAANTNYNLCIIINTGNEFVGPEDDKDAIKIGTTTVGNWLSGGDFTASIK